MKIRGELFWIFDDQVGDIGQQAINLMADFRQYYLIRMLVRENLFSQIELTC